jgi:hypothetical protein
MKKNAFNAVIITLVIAFSLSGCYEPRYYHKNGHHSREYYQRHHHRTPPPGVHFDIHN